MHHGIDLKNPFTMSKKRANAQCRPLKEPNLVSSSLENLVSALCVQARRNLRLLGIFRDHRAPHDALIRKMVEPIGIEPMT